MLEDTNPFACGVFAQKSYAATDAEKPLASLQASLDAISLDESLPPAVATTTTDASLADAAARPPPGRAGVRRVATRGRVAFTVTDSFVEWGAGEAASGLDPFAGGPLARVDAEVTARTWQHLLFEGDVNTAPLTGLLPTFICRSRLEALITIAPRLTRLDHGVLHGQRNCFALLGARGVGKTHFMKSLASVVASIARPSTCVIYVNMKSGGLREPLQLLQDALRRPGPPDAARLVLPEHLLRPDTRMGQLLEFMREHRRRAVLLLDEVEVLYLRADERHRRIHEQLHAIGECSGAARPIMAVLTGSAAVLRSLLFAIPGCKGIEEQYKAYLDFASLNDRKYMPLALRPMVAADDVRRAILCISSGAALDVDALQLEGDLMEPSRGGSSSDADRDGGPAGGAGATASARCAERRAEGTAVGGAGSASSTKPGSELINALADGYSVSDEFLLWVCARCRGLASWIEDALRDRSSRTDQRYHVGRLLGDKGERADRLRRLLDAWVGHTVSMSKSTAVAAANIFDESVCDFALRLMVDEPTAPWLELMDCGAAFVNESADGFRVHFLHPSDAGTLLLQFRTECGSPQAERLQQQSAR